jgi:chromosome segregation ATPase
MTQENTHRQQESLNRFNSEFISNLNSLKDKKRKISIKISKEKKKLASLHEGISKLEKEKNTLVNSVNKKQKNLEMINNTIDSTQSAYEKIIEISHVLLTVIKKDKRNIKEN